ncbi:hypothetical protein [Thermus sp.]
MRVALYYTAFGEEALLPLPSTRPGQKVTELEISHIPLEFLKKKCPESG